MPLNPWLRFAPRFTHGGSCHGVGAVGLFGLEEGLRQTVHQRFASDICCLDGVPYQGQSTSHLATGVRGLWVSLAEAVAL